MRGRGRGRGKVGVSAPPSVVAKSQPSFGSTAPRKRMRVGGSESSTVTWLGFRVRVGVRVGVRMRVRGTVCAN